MYYSVVTTYTAHLIESKNTMNFVFHSNNILPNALKTRVNPLQRPGKIVVNFLLLLHPTNQENLRSIIWLLIQNIMDTLMDSPFGIEYWFWYCAFKIDSLRMSLFDINQRLFLIEEMIFSCKCYKNIVRLKIKCISLEILSI